MDKHRNNEYLHQIEGPSDYQVHLHPSANHKYDYRHGLFPQQKTKGTKNNQLNLS